MIIVKPWHWLKDNGSFPDEPRLRKQVLRVAQCIEYGGPLPRGHARETLITCRRKLDKKPCPGLLWVLKQDDDAIHTFCSVCKRDEYLIYEWEDTDWADGQMEAMDLKGMARDQSKEPSTVRAAPPSATSATRAGRDAPCPCGSGRKYKLCCLPHAPN